jgi:tetratricopeptide (TPR) repeat protein
MPGQNAPITNDKFYNYDEFLRIRTAANSGDLAALQELKAWFDNRHELVENLGNLVKHAQIHLVTSFTGSDTTTEQAIRQLLAEITDDLGYQRATPLAKLAIQRVVTCFAMFYISLNKLATATPGTPTAHYWLDYHQQASKLYDQALKSLDTYHRWLPVIHPVVSVPRPIVPTKPIAPVPKTVPTPPAKRPRRSRQTTEKVTR